MIAALLCAMAADLSGLWTGEIVGRNGVKTDIAFQLIQKGSSVTGKLYGDYKSSPIVSGVVNDHLVTFVVVTQEQAGNEINEARVRFTGRLAGGELELTRERESSNRAGSGAGVAPARVSKQAVRLKRLGSL
jgi:hypothetical protein